MKDMNRRDRLRMNWTPDKNQKKNLYADYSIGNKEREADTRRKNLSGLIAGSSYLISGTKKL